MPNYEEPEADINMPFDTLAELQDSDETVIAYTNAGNKVRGELQAWDKHINVVIKTNTGLSLVRGGSLERLDVNSQSILDL
jgi:small nuclear ribonucleoprotein (snRNP)-like protein